MARFQIVSDSSCDLGRERAKELGVTLVSFYVSFDGENYYREEQDITNREFYQQMADRPGVFPRTSMPTVEDYLTVLRSRRRSYTRPSWSWTARPRRRCRSTIRCRC